MKITKRQLKLIIREAIDPREMEEPLGGWAGDALANDPDYDRRPYEDNQTKMVRRFLALRGEEEKVERMSVGEIERLAADLRLLPPSTKKRWGIYDLRESYMKQRYTEMGDSIISAIEDEPGISGADIVDLVHYDFAGKFPVDKEEVFAILNDMLEDGTIFFDEENDAWFNKEEDLLAWREEGGAWSDEKDYDAGWRR